MHLWSHSFSYYPRFMNISENGDKNCFENWELCLFRHLSSYDNRIVRSSHSCSSLASSGVHCPALRLAFRHSWMQPQDTWTSLPSSMSLHSLATRTDQCFVKDEVSQVWPCLFSFRWCCVHLQRSLLRAGGQILWKKAELSRQRIADDWFWNFRLCLIHQLGCMCWSISCKQWKGEVRKCTGAGVQRPLETVLIACYLPEHKPPVSSIEWLNGT